MPPLQPHEPRIRYRLGERRYCANQAAEDALPGTGWGRFPQPALPVEPDPRELAQGAEVTAETANRHERIRAAYEGAEQVPPFVTPPPPSPEPEPEPVAPPESERPFSSRSAPRKATRKRGRR